MPHEEYCIRKVYPPTGRVGSSDGDYSYSNATDIESVIQSKLINLSI